LRWLACALVLAGCETTRPCRALTMLVTVQLDAATARADRIDVDVSLDGAPSKSNTFGHLPGDPRGTVEIDFPSGYPAGHTAGLTVRAYVAGNVIGTGTAALALPQDCATVEVDATGGP